MNATPSAGGHILRLLPWVVLGGVAGSMTALTISAVLLRHIGPSGAFDPQATLAALSLAGVLNTAGSFLLGLLRGRARRARRRSRPWDPRLLPAVGTGFLGSFTSFAAATAPAGEMLALAVAGRDDPAEWWVFFGAGAGLLAVTAAAMALVGTVAAGLGLLIGQGRSSHRADAADRTAEVDDVHEATG